MSTTVNASVFADVISFSWKFLTPVLVSHSLEFQHGKKIIRVPRLLGGAWVTIKDKTNGLLIMQIWWTDKCGSKKCLHKPGKTLLFLVLCFKNYWTKPCYCTSLYKNTSQQAQASHLAGHVTVSRSAWNSMAQFVADNGNALTPDGQIHRRNCVTWCRCQILLCEVEVPQFLDLSIHFPKRFFAPPNLSNLSKHCYFPTSSSVFPNPGSHTHTQKFNSTPLVIPVNSSVVGNPPAPETAPVGSTPSRWKSSNLANNKASCSFFAKDSGPVNSAASKPRDFGGSDLKELVGGFDLFQVKW